MKRLLEAVLYVFYRSKPRYTIEPLAWCFLCHKDVEDKNLITVTYTDRMGDKKAVDLCRRCYRKMQKRVAKAKKGGLK